MNIWKIIDKALIPSSIVFGVFILLIYILVGAYLFRGCQKLSDQIENDGLKSVFEEIWEGKGGKR